MSRHQDHDSEILQDLKREKKRLHVMKEIAYTELSGELIEIIGDLGRIDQEALRQRIREQGELIEQIGRIDTAIMMFDKKIHDFSK